MVDAYAASARALVAVITALVAQTQVLQAEVEAGFGRHPDVKIYRDQPGLGAILGARVLAVARHVRNRRLADALYQQALSALNNSPGARAYYDAQRARKVGHHQALRALSNRLVGILHGCLRHHTPYDETRLGTPTPRSTSRCLTLTTVGCLAPMHAS